MKNGERKTPLLRVEPSQTPSELSESTERQIKISNQKMRPPRGAGARLAVRDSQTWRERAGKNQSHTHTHSPPVSVWTTEERPNT